MNLRELIKLKVDSSKRTKERDNLAKLRDIKMY